jgi:ribonuclease HI
VVVIPKKPPLSSPEQIKSLADLRSYFKIDKDWDAIIVTDGSATTWEHAAGWASVLLQKTVLEPYVDFGGARRGTNNVAEIMAAFWPLFYLAEKDFGQKEHGYLVHVISDSQYVANGINALEKEGTMWASNASSNRPLWLAMLGCRRKGLKIRGHFVPRDTIDFNRLCHDMANFARIRMKFAHKDLDKAGWKPDDLMED